MNKNCEFLVVLLRVLNTLSTVFFLLLLGGQVTTLVHAESVELNLLLTLCGVRGSDKGWRVYMHKNLNAAS